MFFGSETSEETSSGMGSSQNAKKVKALKKSGGKVDTRDRHIGGDF